jgi:hypothetical protein
VSFHLFRGIAEEVEKRCVATDDPAFDVAEDDSRRGAVEEVLEKAWAS